MIHAQTIKRKPVDQFLLFLLAQLGETVTRIYTAITNWFEVVEDRRIVWDPLDNIAKNIKFLLWTDVLYLQGGLQKELQM